MSTSDISNPWAAEAERRWGGTEAYEESTRRTASYNAKDWEAIRREEGEIYQAFLELMTRSVAANDPQAGAAVDRHRLHISKWFYECPPEIHADLGEMYVQDGRFTAGIDAYGEGLADYLSGAIAARYA